MTTGFTAGPSGHRTELDEAAWAGVVAATALDVGQAPLRPLGAPRATAGDPEPALVEAAGLALGRADVGVTVLAGAGERGVLAQIGADRQVLGSAVRAVVTGAPGAPEPTAVPGVRLGARATRHLVDEVMWLVPPGGVDCALPRESVALERDHALVIARAVGADDEVALLAARHAGFDTVPPVLRAVAGPTTASVTLTISTCADPVHGVRQWLLTDHGWVSLTMLGRRVVHTPRSRDDLATELTSVLAGAWDAALAARWRAS